MSQDNGTTIEQFDKATYSLFKKAYQDAESDGRYMFVFNNVEYLTQYAKYVLEYLENKFKG